MNCLNLKNSVLAAYLIGSFKFFTKRALSVSGSFTQIKSLEKAEKVVKFFKNLGFSDAHIQSIEAAATSLPPFPLQPSLPMRRRRTTAIAIEDVGRDVMMLRALTRHKKLVQFYEAYEDEDNVM